MRKNTSLIKIIKFVSLKLHDKQAVVGLYILLGLISRIIIIAFPYLTGVFIDNLTKMKTFEVILGSIIQITILGFLSFVLSISTSYLGSMLQYSTSNDLVVFVFEKLSLVNLSWYRKMDSAYLSAKVTADCNEVSKFVIDNLFNFFFHVITCIVVSVYWIKINRSIALIFVAFLPLFVFSYIMFKKKMYISNKIFAESISKLNAQKNQYLRRLESFRLVEIHCEHLENLRYEIRVNISHLKSKMIWSNLFTNLNSLVTTVARGGIFYYSSISIYNGLMSIGEFTIVNSLFSIVLSSVNYFLSVSEISQSSRVAYDRLFEIISISNTPNGKIPVHSLDNIVINQISLTSETGTILKTNDYTLVKGKIYVITGDNGKGKSTLVRIVLGLFNGEYRGKIKINGTEISELDMINFRKDKVSFVEQNPFIAIKGFGSTLCQNIDGDSLALDDHLINFFSLSSVLEGLSPDSINGLSGGEIQKIAIIDSLKKDSELLIMDEPNSALDIQSTRKLLELLPQCKHNKIILIISHDIIFHSIADDVIVI